jgi:hypothetical protein
LLDRDATVVGRWRPPSGPGRSPSRITALERSHARAARFLLTPRG